MSDIHINKIFSYYSDFFDIISPEQNSEMEILPFGDGYSRSDISSDDTFSRTALFETEGASEEIAGFINVLSELSDSDYQYIADLIDENVEETQYGVFIVDTDARHIKRDNSGRETYDIYTLISAQEMEDAKASGKYGNLDDKMIASLIVAEKTFDFINNDPDNFDKAILPSLQTMAKRGITGLNSENIKQFFDDLFIGRANIDKRIGDFSQSNKQGDCWLLAALKSLSYTPEGQKMIKDAIKLNQDGSYTVNFDGVNTQINISQKELNDALKSGQYSKGDSDVLLFELATEKVLKIIADGGIKAPDDLIESAKTGLTNGQFKHVIYLLTGEDTETVYNYNNEEIYSKYQKPRGFSLDNEFYDKMEQFPNDYAAIVALIGKEMPDGTHGDIIVKDIYGNEIKLADEQHGCSIKSVNGDTVTIVNPWNSEQEITVKKSELEQYITYIQYYKFS